MTTLLNDRGNYNLFCRFLRRKEGDWNIFWTGTGRPGAEAESVDAGGRDAPDYERQGTYGVLPDAAGSPGYVNGSGFPGAGGHPGMSSRKISGSWRSLDSLPQKLVKNYKTVNFTKISQEGIGRRQKRDLPEPPERGGHPAWLGN